MCQLYTIWSTFCIVLTLRNKRASAVMIRQFKESPAVSPSGQEQVLQLRKDRNTHIDNVELCYDHSQLHSHHHCQQHDTLPLTTSCMYIQESAYAVHPHTHTHTHTWKSHAYLHLHISNSAGHVLTRLPGAPYELHTAHMHIDTNTYITFTFRWCFHKQKANNEHKHTHTRALLDADTN